MAASIFLILCGLSTAFLVYVLVQFWKEGHYPRDCEEALVAVGRRRHPDVIVVTHPISLSAHGGISVIPLQVRLVDPGNRRERSSGKGKVLAMPGRPATIGEWECNRDARSRAR